MSLAHVDSHPISASLASLPTETTSKVARDSPLPLYYQLKQIIAAAIRSGTWPRGGRIPTESELQAAYGLSRTTVRQALNELVRDGLLSRIQGKGTFVAASKMETSIERMHSFSEEMLQRGQKPSARLLSFRQVKLASTIAQHMHIPVGTAAIRYERLRTADERPVAYQVCWVRADLNVRLQRQDLEGRGSLFRTVESQGLRFAGAEESLEAIAASKKEARLLDISPGDPMVLVQRVWYLQDGSALGFGRMSYRGDCYRYFHWIPR